MRLHSFLAYCALIAGFVYPVVTSWVWNLGGWLAIRSYHDFAGTGCIHFLGGTAAMWGALIVGPRYQKQKNRATLKPEVLFAEKEFQELLKEVPLQEQAIFKEWTLA
jgi:Amt family ammonium transporter